MSINVGTKCQYPRKQDQYKNISQCPKGYSIHFRIPVGHFGINMLIFPLWNPLGERKEYHVERHHEDPVRTTACRQLVPDNRTHTHTSL